MFKNCYLLESSKCILFATDLVSVLSHSESIRRKDIDIYYIDCGYYLRLYLETVRELARTEIYSVMYQETSSMVYKNAKSVRESVMLSRCD